MKVKNTEEGGGREEKYKIEKREDQVNEEKGK